MIITDGIPKGLEFEQTCLDLLARLGFTDLRVTKKSGDQGADIIGDFNTSKYVFQCKGHKRSQGNKAVQQAITAKSFYRAHRCGVISESVYTPAAHQLAKPNHCLLFTESELNDAVNRGATFLDLISGYEFPSYVSIEHDLDIIKEYEKLKAKLGRTPKWLDFDPTTQYHIKKKYKNLKNLLRTLGDEPFTRRPSNEQIVQEYIRVKQAIGKIPTLADIEKHSDFSRNCFSSYPFTRLQKECGDAPNVERGVTKDDLIKEFRNLEYRLGRTPTLRDLDEKGLYRSSYYRRRWDGDIDNFLEELGISKRSFKPRRYTNVEVTLIYILLEKIFEIREGMDDFRINSRVLENLKFEGKMLVSPTAITKRYGGWEAFMGSLNAEPVRNFSESLELIIDKLRKLS